ncbi:hypothetical protein RJ639_008427 [Escallonia herrerae]|uniref:Reverse transcriptase RNase H-like domain-containing protein n=1 Tax=Escallonia herrerae TaxID=1293975 RepID=A0AA88VTB2_9ASTE|nr:hypothetical protein RJ639_008427 [Escallonia herrerae]
MKQGMSKDPVLALLDVSKSFEVYTDASDYALGGVLMQECHHVAYESRKLNEAKCHYTTHEKELLAVVHCLRVWRHYLLGSSFVVQTKNTAVSHFLSQSKLTSKQARWQELSAEFNFMLEYRASSTNSVTNALSRRAELDQLASTAMNAIVRIDSRVAINVGKKVEKALTKDSVAQQLLKLVDNGSAAVVTSYSERPNTRKSPRAVSFSKEWRQNIDLAHSYIEKAARRMKKHADKNRRSQEFNVGDKVMVKLLP